jgi:hypothetical protein
MADAWYEWPLWTPDAGIDEGVKLHPIKNDLS